MADRIINWERFKLTNNDERGVQLRFEDLCRQLFIREYLSGNKIVNSYQHKGCEFKEYLTILNKEVLDLPDIAAENIVDSFYWFDKVYFSVKKYYKKIENEKDRTKKKSDKLYEVYRRNEISGKRKEAAKQKYFEAKYRWETLNDLLSIILPLSISDYEKKLITGKALPVTGKAGVGKSQLLANAISLLIESGQNALLLLGHLFCTDQPMPIQIIEKAKVEKSDGANKNN